MTQAPPTLSGYLLEKANRRLGYPKRIDPKTAELLSPVAESLWKDNLGPVAQDPRASVPDSILDEFLCRVLLRKVPEIVRRTSVFPPFKTLRRPPDDVVVCAAEAFRCFVFEFWDASVALSRAALETALKQELHRLGIPPPETLSEIIERSRTLRVLNDAAHQAAKKIKNTGDRVLHGEREARKSYHADEAAAEATQASLRAAIGHIYGLAPGT
jgi:hypothetical protein